MDQKQRLALFVSALEQANAASDGASGNSTSNGSAPGESDPSGNTKDQPKSENTTANTSAASINNKVPATFTKGSASFSNVDDQLVKKIIEYLAKSQATKTRAQNQDV